MRLRQYAAMIALFALGCAQSGDLVTHGLTSTRWVLVQLGPKSVAPAEGEREPFFALDAGAQRVVGYAGCNRLSGGYQQTDSTLTFSALAMTRMACPQMELEDAFVKALGATASFRIEGSQLELFDASGAPIATLEAKNL